MATFEDIQAAFLEHDSSENKTTSAEMWFEAKTNPFDLVNTTPAEDYVKALECLLGDTPFLARIVLIAFDWKLLELAKQQIPNIQTGFLSIDFSWLPNSLYMSTRNHDRAKWFGNFNPKHYNDSLPQAVTEAQGTYWSPYIGDLSKSAVSEAHDLGIKVSTWGADSPKDIAKALSMGVDSLTTAYVDRAKNLL